jgi:hypothetical protein
VTQAAVSRWERGLDEPAPEVLRRLHDLMARTQRDELAIERAFLGRQAAMRALFDLDGVRLLGASAGMLAAWPNMTGLLDRRLSHHLVGDIARVLTDADFVHELRTGTIVLVTGVADRHLRLDNPHAFRHRWHARIRHYGDRTIIDMHYEACRADAPLGVEAILHLEDIARH